MYDTRWPRPGPALLVVSTIIGLIVGGILGISFPASSADQQAETTTTVTAPQTTAPAPANFFTVVLASPSSFKDAQARMARFRSQGIADVRILARTQYPALGRPFAVCAGVYQSSALATRRVQELKAQYPGLSPQPYPRQVRRGP